MNSGFYVDPNLCEGQSDITLCKKNSRYFILARVVNKVFRFFAQVNNAKEIATMLGKSYKTVENQKHAVMCKMVIKTDLELFKIASRLNLTYL